MTGIFIYHSFDKFSDELPLMADMWELNVENSDKTNCAIMYKKDQHFWWKPVKCSDSYHSLCVNVTDGKHVKLDNVLGYV